MSRLEQEVISLKKKVKELEQQITERTRNYLLHIGTIKKSDHSGFKKKKSNQNQKLEFNVQQISTFKNQIKKLQAQNLGYLSQINEKDRIIEVITTQLQHQKNENIHLKTKNTQLSKTPFSPSQAIIQQIQKTAKLIDQLQQKSKSDSEIISKLTNQLQISRNQQNQQIKKLRKQKDELEQTIQQLKFTNNNISQKIQKKVDSIDSLKDEIFNLQSSYRAICEQKKQIETILNDSNKQSKAIKQKYYGQILKSNDLMEQVSNIKSLAESRQKIIKQLENDKQKLKVQIDNNVISIQRSPSKQVKQTQMNTEPVKIKQPKKVQLSESSTIIHHDHDEELLKLNDKLNEQLIKREEEYKRLLLKIDQTEKQNNRLIGNVNSLKRDIDYEREAQKILNQKIHENTKVIENQKNTIVKLEQQYQKLEMESKDEYMKMIDSRSISKQASEDNDIDSKNKDKNIQEQDLHHGWKSPIARIANQIQKQKDMSQISEHISEKRSIQSSPFRQAQKYNQGKFQIQKKYSTNTQGPQKIQQFDVKTPSIKSSRINTPSDLKNNLKNIIDNTPMLGKGVQFIQLIIAIIKQVQYSPGPSYDDVLIDLQKKKQLQQSAFHSGIIKQITQISKVRQECQQQIQTIKQQSTTFKKQQQQLISQLKSEALKQQHLIQQLKQKNEHLQQQSIKTKKTQSQKQLVTKTSMKKISGGENDQVVEKLKQQKLFLLEKIETYEQSINEYDSLKRRMFMQNEKQKSEILYLRQQFKKTEQWIQIIENLKQNAMNKTQEQSQQFIDILLSERISQQFKKKQILLQLKDKQQVLSHMAQQIDVLKQTIKKRQGDLVQIGRQISIIRTQHQQQQNDDTGQSVTFLRRQQQQLRIQLKQKQQTNIKLQKQLSRHKNQITSLTKIIQQQKQKNRIINKQKRQLSDQISGLMASIDTYQRKLAYINQQQLYFAQKSSNEFQEIMEKLYFIKKKEKQNKLKNKGSTNLLKTIQSTKLESQGSNNEKTIKQNKHLKQFLKQLTQEIYRTYVSLPHTSQASTLFEAQNKQQLLNQLKDVKQFASQYCVLKSAVQTKVHKNQHLFLNLIKSIIKNHNDIDENYLNQSIQQLKIEEQDENTLKQSISSIFLSSKSGSKQRSSRKNPSIQPIQL